METEGEYEARGDGVMEVTKGKTKNKGGEERMQGERELGLLIWDCFLCDMD